ncbi:cytochrome P450 [Microdochium trichocladiopsis]|uniref:Cytochrome P450 n=1 Tax=Microdochium trichocladiopsis TaxID=1682393 RepID=A0A9P8XS89_9PEZI|nr:cytochrome P450 [Microdochium trichocladiopsis]KAH7014275.1 cytochrome P450 [Microdochium trichocladiopsis]
MSPSSSFAGNMLPPLAIAALALGLLPVTIAIYNLFFHPLARIPGPKLAAVTRLWFAYHARLGRSRGLTRWLHATYGPVVRVTPNMVWFVSADGFKQVYRAGSPFGKADWYYAVAAGHGPVSLFPMKREAPDTLDLVAEMYMPRYRAQRRLIGPTYSQANLQNHEVAVDEVVERFVAKLRQLEGKEVDLMEWMHILAIECLTAVTFRWSPGLIEAGTNYDTLWDGYFQFWRYASVVGLFPRIVLLSHKLGLKSKRFLQRLVALGVPSCPPPSKNIWMGIVGQMMSQSVGTRDVQKEPIGGLSDDLVRLHQEKPEFKQEYLSGMVSATLFAGGDTLTASLMAVIAQANHLPEVKARVMREIETSDIKGTASFQTVNSLEYTTATIKESMRHWPVVGLAMYREVPARGLTLEGYNIPPGTTVGTSPLAMHLSKEIFGEDAEEFKPERWLDEEYRLALEKYNFAFGSPNRSCPGRNISEQAIFKAFPTLMKHFDIEIVKMPHEDDMLTYGTAIMNGVKVKFHPRA